MKKLLWMTTLLLVMILSTACGPNPDSPTDDHSPIPTEIPDEETYPAPEQTNDVVEVQPLPTDASESDGSPYPEPEQPVNPAPVEPAYPGPEDTQKIPIDDRKRGNVFIDEKAILIMEGDLGQVKLRLIGNLPTPCHELRTEVLPPDEENNIYVEAYSLVSPDIMCTQVLEPFDTEISLGNFTEGEYTVWINGEEFTTFELP